MGSNYEYLPVSAMDAKRAWYDFQAMRDGRSRNSRSFELASVAFIPALGGSFVVLTEPERRRWAAALKPAHWAFGTQHADALLQSFKRYLTGG